MRSSSPAISRSQLAAEQPETEECWIPPKKDTPHQRAKEKPPKNGRRVKLHLESKPPKYVLFIIGDWNAKLES